MWYGILIECFYLLYLPSCFLLGLSGVKSMVIIVWGTLNVYRYLKVNKQNNKGSIMVKIENESNDFVLLISQQIMTLLYMY